MRIREALQGKLTEKELTLVKQAFDMIGNIAILDIPKELIKKQKAIAEAVMKLNRQITTVVKKKGIHTGEFRIQHASYLAGERTKETVHRENGVMVKLDIGKCYFSPRLVTERKRIAGLVGQGEEILVMFSGVGIYCVVLAKNTKAKEIIGIEKNPVAHEYAEENVRLNKARNVRVYCGDVKNVVPKLKKAFDRILMPLPMGAEDYLDLALSVVKRKGIIHFYDFLHESEFPHVAEEKVLKACSTAGRKCKILQTVKCGDYAPRRWRVCVDVEVE